MAGDKEPVEYLKLAASLHPAHSEHSQQRGSAGGALRLAML